MRLMLCKFHSTVVVTKVAQRHQEHRNEALHWRRNRIQFRLGILFLRVVECQKDDIISLRKAHHKHHVNADESQQISHNHSVYHHYERPDGLEASEKSPKFNLSLKHCAAFDKNLQKNRKYGDVVSMIATAT